MLLWDRKSEGGFPETKVLKQRVRDCIDPARDLGHSDVGGKKNATTKDSTGDATGTKVEVNAEREAQQTVQGDEKQIVSQSEAQQATSQDEECEDCK